MLIKICIGSSCHIKGSAEIVDLFTEKLNEHNLSEDVTLSGSFCLGKCNRLGVTVQIDDKIHTGITTENFNEFFKDNVLSEFAK